MAELKMGDLQLGVHTIDQRIVFAPVELKGLTRCKRQRDKRVPGSRPSGFLLLLTPEAGKGGNPVIETGIA